MLHTNNTLVLSHPQIELPLPTNYWQPLPHNALLKLLKDNCKGMGWEPKKVEFQTSNNGSNFAASLAIEVIDLPTISVLNNHKRITSQFSLGVLNSNSQTTAMKLLWGITANEIGVPFGELTLGHHQPGVLKDLPVRLRDALESVEENLLYLSERIERLEEIEIPKELADSLLVRCGRGYVAQNCVRGGLMPWARIGLVDDLYRKGPDTAWHLLWSFCTIVRLNPPLSQMTQALKFLRLLEGNLP